MKQTKGKGNGVLFIVIVIIIFTSSCVSHRELISLNEGDQIAQTGYLDTTSQFIMTPKFQEYKIRPNDQLMIRVNAFSGSTEDFINREFSPGDNNNIRFGFDPASVHFNSYVVTDSGYVILPMLDKVYVSGKELSEVKTMLDEAYKPYLRLASTNVKLANRRITVLGEVSDPGIHYLYNEQNTLLEAIGLAGDFTNFGNRNKVKLIRKIENGSKTVYLNLNRSDFMRTEYFYVQPNDVVYIEPLKPKAFEVSARSVGVVISAISLGAIIANLFIR